MEILGVITARANSRRLPRKNVLILCGKPVIVYTIEAAQKSKLLTRLVLSSDDLHCIEIANGYGVEVPFVRPAYLATGEAKSIDVLIHAVEFLQDKEEYRPEIVMILEPTSPLRTYKDIDYLLEQQIKNNYESAYCIMGGMFAVRRDVLLKKHTLYGESALDYIIPKERAIDINTHQDFELATILMRNALQSNKLRSK